MNQVLMRLMFAALTLLASQVVDARPFRGSTPIHVLLCQTSDDAAAPQPVKHYQDLLFTRGTGGLADYWDNVSYSNFDNAGSVVHGWYRMKKTTAQMMALGRWDRVNACIDAARTASSGAFNVPSDGIRYIVTSPSIDLFGWTGGAFLPFDFDVGAVAHEGGHGIGLDHTFSNDPAYQSATWSAIGEYDDPWDAMSWANSFRALTPFGDRPSGLVAAQLDRLGWLPRTRIAVHGSDGAADTTYTLAATNYPGAAGALLVRVPFDPGDLFRYYTIEFRLRYLWSHGIPDNTVLIHEVKRGTDASGKPTGPQIAWLQRNLTRADKAPTQDFNANGVHIKVISVDINKRQAVVTVHSEMAQRCLMGFVWREAGPGDHVCVFVAERADARYENAIAFARRQPGGGPYGPDSCGRGFVWREAFANDHVCVAPASRTRASKNNATAASRMNPARQSFGPNTCKSGFVWREADTYDWVCVSPAVRQQTRDENSLASSRRQPGGGPYGPDSCRQGFVWREAYLNDHVCVAKPIRATTRIDNVLAASRLAIP